jgi:hypothetical protein
MDIHHNTDKNIIVTGYTYSTNFPTTNTSYDTASNGGYDAILLKMNFTISAPPMAPTNLNGTMSSSGNLLTWTPPANTGTSPLIGYKIYRYETGGNGSGNWSAWWYPLFRTIPGPASFWKDTNTTLGKDYYYYIRAYNLVGDSPDSNYIMVTDYQAPQFLADHTPSSCYSGEGFTFTTAVIDNVKLQSVEVTYWHPGDMPRSGMMLKVDNVNWSFSIDLDLDCPKAMRYRFRAKDYYDWITDSEEGNVRIINGRPYFFSDTTPTEGTTGETLSFGISIKDDSSVSQVSVEYWYGSGATNNVTMTSSTADTWSHEITLEHSIHTLKYFYHARDASGHWNQTQIKQVSVIDNDNPMIVLDDTASTAGTGEDLMFFVEVSDNIEVSSVSAEYWFGEGAHDNVTMEMWSVGQWRLAVGIPTDDLSDLHYCFWVSDTTSNIIEGPQKTVRIDDVIKPEIMSDKTLDRAYTGSEFKFYIQVTDNIDVDEVWIEYWFEGGGKTNLSAVEGTDMYWEMYIDIPHMLDDLLYLVHVRDTSGNWFTSDTGSSLVRDNVKPVFLEDTTPEEISTGGDLVFEIQVSDNIETKLIMVEYWIGYGDHYNVTMEGTGPFTFSIPISIDDDDDVRYIFRAMDSSLNWNQTAEGHVIVVDNIAPELSGNPTPSSAVGGSKFTISVYFDDNIEVGQVKVEYWFDDGEHVNASMTGEEPYRLIIDLPTEGGTLYYRFHATDSNGNEMASELEEVTVSKKGTEPVTDDDDDDDIVTDDDDDDAVITPQDEKFPAWGWILVIVLILIIVLTVINILVSVMRKKKPEPEQVSAEQPAAPQPQWPPSFVQYGQPPQQQQEAYYPQEQPQVQDYPVPEPEPVYQNIPLEQPQEQAPVEGFSIPEPEPEPVFQSIPLEEKPTAEEPVVPAPDMPVQEKPMVHGEPAVQKPPALGDEVPPDVPEQQPPEGTEQAQGSLVTEGP